MKPNQDIRDYMEDHCVSQKNLAKEMGIAQYTVWKKLQTEMCPKDKETYLAAIDACASKVNQNFVNEALAEEPEIEEESTTKFQIGDRVKIPAKQDMFGTISDIWSSLAQDRTMYEVTNEGNCSKGLYAENQLELAPIPIEYRWEANIAAGGNVAVVTMHAKQGDKEWVYARGHAHILHDGEVGMAQAISYAARRMFESLDSKQENKIYVKGGN